MYQKQYILSMLEQSGLANANTVAIPEDTSVKPNRDDGVSKFLSDTTQYQPMVGALLYASMAMRPDIAHAVGVLGKFNRKPNKSHPTAIQACILLPWNSRCWLTV